MALPNSIDPAAPAGTDQISAGDNQIRALKQFIVDVLNLPTSPTTVSAAFPIQWDGDGSTHLQSATAGSVAADANADELVLEASGEGGLSILTPAANAGSIYFGSPTSATDGRITYHHSADTPADAMAFYVNDGEVSRLTSGPILYINETSNSNMTIGITANQVVSTDLMLDFKSDDVAHGMTTLAETDSFFAIGTVADSDGGALLHGFTDNIAAVQVRGNSIIEDVGKTGSDEAAIILSGHTKSGTTSSTMGANANIVAIRNHTTTRFIFDADGDSHQAVGTAWTTLSDEYPDWELARALKASLAPDNHELSLRYKHLIDEYKPIFANNKMVTYNDDGEHFISVRNTLLFTLDGLFQTGQKVFVEHDDRIKKLEEKILVLAEGKSDGN